MVKYVADRNLELKGLGCEMEQNSLSLEAMWKHYVLEE